MNIRLTTSFTITAGLIAASSVSYAADPATMFTVAVLKNVESVFVDRLEVYHQTDYQAGGCVKNPPGQPLNRVNKHFPMHRTPAGHHAYTRIFYECPTPSMQLFAAFGDASFEAAKASTSGVKEPVRINADTIILPPPGGACSAMICANGTYRKTSDPRTCPAC